MLSKHFDDNSDLDFKGTIGDNEYSFNILDELHFDEDTINEALKDHAKQVALIGTMTDEAKQIVEIKEAALKIFKSSHWTKIKNGQVDDAGKKFTDTAVSAMVDSDAGTLDRQSEIVDMRFQLNCIRSTWIASVMSAACASFSPPRRAVSPGTISGS